MVSTLLATAVSVCILIATTAEAGPNYIGCFKLPVFVYGFSRYVSLCLPSTTVCPQLLFALNCCLPVSTNNVFYGFSRLRVGTPTMLLTLISYQVALSLSLCLPSTLTLISYQAYLVGSGILYNSLNYEPGWYSSVTGFLKPGSGYFNFLFVAYFIGKCCFESVCPETVCPVCTL